MRTAVDETLEMIRPALQADGGDIRVVDLREDEGVLDVELLGACGGCPMSTMTLKAGVERILKDRVEGLNEVRALGIDFGEGVDDGPDGDRRACATIEIFRRAYDGSWERRQSVHRQRHRSRAEVEHALRDAGLRSVAVLGQLTGAVLEDHLDENVHTKALFIARPR